MLPVTHGIVFTKTSNSLIHNYFIYSKFIALRGTNVRRDILFFCINIEHDFFCTTQLSFIKAKEMSML